MGYHKEISYWQKQESPKRPCIFFQPQNAEELRVESKIISSKLEIF
jgi:hypothetical protein